MTLPLLLAALACLTVLALAFMAREERRLAREERGKDRLEASTQRMLIERIADAERRVYDCVVLAAKKSDDRLDVLEGRSQDWNAAAREVRVLANRGKR